MAKKRREKETAGKPTRRQLSHLQKQKRRQRIISIAGVAVIGAVLLLVGIGAVTQWFIPVYLPSQQTVLEVGGKKYNMDYYIKALDYYTGGRPEYASIYLDFVIESITYNELVRLAAGELGYAASNQEVRETIAEAGLEDNRAVRDIVATQLVISKIRTEHFGTQIPQSDLQREVLAVFVESQSRAAEVIAALEEGGDLAELAADSLDSYAAAEEGQIGWRPRGVLDGLLDSEGIDDAVFDADPGVWTTFCDAEKSKALGYWLIELLEKNEEDGTVHVRAILLSSEEDALGIRERLEAGEDFGGLAAEFSRLDDADEDMGDLGFISETENATAVFEEFVFAEDAELNQLSQPLADDGVSTDGGCWAFQVAGEEERDVSDENRQILVGAALNEWYQGVIDDPAVEVVNLLDDEKRDFAVDRLTGG